MTKREIYVIIFVANVRLEASRVEYRQNTHSLENTYTLNFTWKIMLWRTQYTQYKFAKDTSLGILPM